jgi:hypothetical protein
VINIQFTSYYSSISCNYLIPASKKHIFSQTRKRAQWRVDKAKSVGAWEETPRTNMKTDNLTIETEPSKPHVPREKRTAKSSAKTMASGAAIHPEIIAKATEPGDMPEAMSLGASSSHVVFYDFPGEADFLMEHYCNLNRIRQHEPWEFPSLRDSRLDRFMKPGKHPQRKSTKFGCITERKGNGATFTLTLDRRLYAILGVATDEESASLVWAWLSKQYDILRTASRRMNHTTKPGNLELRCSRVLGQTYDRCEMPDIPGNWPWFSYIVNDDSFYESIPFFPDPMPQLGYQWCRHIRFEKMRETLARPTDKVLEI